MDGNGKKIIISDWKILSSSKTGESVANMPNKLFFIFDPTEYWDGVIRFPWQLMANKSTTKNCGSL